MGLATALKERRDVCNLTDPLINLWTIADRTVENVRRSGAGYARARGRPARPGTGRCSTSAPAAAAAALADLGPRGHGTVCGGSAAARP